MEGHKQILKSDFERLKELKTKASEHVRDEYEVLKKLREMQKEEKAKMALKQRKYSEIVKERYLPEPSERKR